MDDATGAETLAKCRVFRVIRVLWPIFRIKMIEVAVELVKTVVAGQRLIFVDQVILTELPSGIAQRYQQLSDGRIFSL